MKHLYHTQSKDRRDNSVTSDRFFCYKEELSEVIDLILVGKEREGLILLQRIFPDYLPRR